MIFFLILTVRGHFHRKDFKWKIYGGTGLISETTKALYAELKERAKAASSSYSVTSDFSQYIYSVPVTKNHQANRSMCLVLEFPFTDIFTEQLYWRKILCGCFRFIWLWLLISIMKRCAEQCALQFVSYLLKLFF